MKKIDIDSNVEKEINNFFEMNEDDQLKQRAEYIGQLIECLPNPENEAEFNEFVKLYKYYEKSCEGKTADEAVQIFLSIGASKPKFLEQCIALSTLSIDLTSLEELAKENANNVPKKASVAKVTKDDIQAEKTAETKERLSKIIN